MSGSTWLFIVSMMVMTSLGTSDNSPVAPAVILVVANHTEHTVLLVDPETRRELARIVVGVNGHEVMASKDGRFAYVPSTATPASAGPALMAAALTSLICTSANSPPRLTLASLFVFTARNLVPTACFMSPRNSPMPST